MSELAVVYEDEWLVAVNKPAGLLVHANPGSHEANLQDLLSEERGRRLVLFHRLDKDTSGLVILGKRPEINAGMTQLFEEKKIRKLYDAVVSGQWPRALNRLESKLARGKAGRMIESDGGKIALTTFRLRASDLDGDKSWLEVLPKTGRTHQIRVHCASVGHPVLGDRLYGVPNEKPANQAGNQSGDKHELALHARQADFMHPLTKQTVRIVANPPASWSHSFFAGFQTQSASGPKLREKDEKC